MGKNPKSGKDKPLAVEAKLKLVRQIAEIKRHADGKGPKQTLRDEDFTVVNITLRVPSSKLLGSRPDESPTPAAGPDPIGFDSDPSDIVQADHDPPIVLPP